MSQESRLKVGVDVPWVTSWSDEESLGVRPCPTVGGRLAVCQAERPGLGKPQYSLNHFRRQRETVGRMLCPMCGEPTVAGDRWTQIAKRVPAGLVWECVCKISVYFIEQIIRHKSEKLKIKAAHIE